MSHLFFAQKAFILKDGCLLLVRKSPDDPNQPGLWEVPGGRMDFGEDIDEHLRREVREEVGLEVVPGDPFHIWQWRVSRTAKEGYAAEWQIVAVARICLPVSGELSTSGRVEEDYLAEMEWVPFRSLENYDLIANMRPVVKAFLKKIGVGVDSQ
jgi:8-oxo-dGTP pyrophosphatase MutT (NUDIX family)